MRSCWFSPLGLKLTNLTRLASSWCRRWSSVRSWTSRKTFSRQQRRQRGDERRRGQVGWVGSTSSRHLGQIIDKWLKCLMSSMFSSTSKAMSQDTASRLTQGFFIYFTVSVVQNFKTISLKPNLLQGTCMSIRVSHNTHFFELSYGLLTSHANGFHGATKKFSAL